MKFQFAIAVLLSCFLVYSCQPNTKSNNEEWTFVSMPDFLNVDCDYPHEGRDSKFWQTMKNYNIDTYLCGEVHAVTCIERDGIMQVAHGGLIGYNTRTKYMVVNVRKDKIELEIKEIEMLPHGEHLWQRKNNRPLKNVTITDADKEKGFYTVGSATIDKTNGKKIVDRTGYFLKKYEKSDEIAVPVFKKNNKGGLPIELPKVLVKK